MLEDAAKFIAIASAFVAGTLGVYQYYKNSLWSRKKYAAEEVRKLYASEPFMFCLGLFDWPDREFRVPDARSGQEFVKVDTARLCHILSDRVIAYDPLDTYARDCFDQLITNVEWLCDFVDAGVMTWDDFTPYFGYLAEMVMGDRHLDPAVRDGFWQYARTFNNGPSVERFIRNVHARYKAAKRSS
jgi:hypothetical protein